jgi:hypothetical protein
MLTYGRHVAWQVMIDSPGPFIISAKEPEHATERFLHALAQSGFSPWHLQRDKLHDKVLGEIISFAADQPSQSLPSSSVKTYMFHVQDDAWEEHFLHFGHDPFYS